MSPVSSSGSGMDPPSLSESDANCRRDGGRGSPTLDCAWIACGGVEGTLVCRSEAEPGEPTPRLHRRRGDEPGEWIGGGGPTRWTCGADTTGGEGSLGESSSTDLLDPLDSRDSLALCTAVRSSETPMLDRPALARSLTRGKPTEECGVRGGRSRSTRPPTDGGGREGGAPSRRTALCAPPPTFFDAAAEALPLLTAALPQLTAALSLVTVTGSDVTSTALSDSKVMHDAWHATVTQHASSPEATRAHSKVNMFSCAWSDLLWFYHVLHE